MPQSHESNPAQLASEVGRFFQDLRRIYGWTPEEAAKRLATRVDIIAVLEAGDVRQLPPWPETCRIVRTYVSFAQLDPRPALNLIEALRSQMIVAEAAKPRLPQRLATKGTDAVAALRRGQDWIVSRTTSDWRQVLRNPRMVSRLLIAAAIPIGLIVLLTQTSVLEAAVSHLPPSLARIVRGAQDYVTVHMAPVRNGLRHIEVDDPRSRRTDKLPVAAGSD